MRTGEKQSDHPTISSCNIIWGQPCLINQKWTSIGYLCRCSKSILKLSFCCLVFPTTVFLGGGTANGDSQSRGHCQGQKLRANPATQKMKLFLIRYLWSLCRHLPYLLLIYEHKILNTSWGTGQQEGAPLSKP
jgi:hypothetical protein